MHSNINIIYEISLIEKELEQKFTPILRMEEAKRTLI